MSTFPSFLSTFLSFLPAFSTFLPTFSLFLPTFPPFQSTFPSFITYITPNFVLFPHYLLPFLQNFALLAHLPTFPTFLPTFFPFLFHITTNFPLFPLFFPFLPPSSKTLSAFRIFVFTNLSSLPTSSPFLFHSSTNSPFFLFYLLFLLSNFPPFLFHIPPNPAISPSNLSFLPLSLLQNFLLLTSLPHTSSFPTFLLFVYYPSFSSPISSLFPSSFSFLLPHLPHSFSSFTPFSFILLFAANPQLLHASCPPSYLPT